MNFNLVPKPFSNTYSCNKYYIHRIRNFEIENAMLYLYNIRFFLSNWKIRWRKCNIRHTLLLKHLWVCLDIVGTKCIGIKKSWLGLSNLVLLIFFNCSFTRWLLSLDVKCICIIQIHFTYYITIWWNLVTIFKL